MKHEFPNGFQFVYEQSLHHIPITHINIYVKVGSAYETQRVRGVSHLVEHMCFKGTHHIQKPRNILLQYNQVGAYFNAYTEKRYTCYVVVCDNEHIEKISQQMADMILHSSFSKKEFDKEQHVVVEENIRLKDNHAAILEVKVDECIYKGSSYQFPIDSISYHPTATHLSYQDTVDWYKSHYHPSNMVCSIVSSLSYSKIMNLLKKTVFMENNSNTPSRFALPTPVLSLKPIHHILIKKQQSGMSLDLISIAFRTCSMYDNDYYPLMVVKHIMNGFSGKLFTLLRTNHGLTYRSSCALQFHEHTGYLSINIQTDPNKVMNSKNGVRKGVMSLVMRLLNQMKHGVSEEDVRIAKGNLKGTYLLSQQDDENMVEYNGKCALFNMKRVPYHHIYKKYIAHLTVASINKVIQKYIYYDNMVFGIMFDKEIPTKQLEEVCHLLRA
jgi:zinc protease